MQSESIELLRQLTDDVGARLAGTPARRFKAGSTREGILPAPNVTRSAGSGRHTHPLGKTLILTSRRFRIQLE